MLINFAAVMCVGTPVPAAAVGVSGIVLCVFAGFCVCVCVCVPCTHSECTVVLHCSCVFKAPGY